MSDNTSNGHASLNPPHFSALDQLKPYDLAALKTYDLSSRPSKVFHDDLGQPVAANASAEDWLLSLPQTARRQRHSPRHESPVPGPSRRADRRGRARRPRHQDRLCPVPHRLDSSAASSRPSP